MGDRDGKYWFLGLVGLLLLALLLYYRRTKPLPPQSSLLIHQLSSVKSATERQAQSARRLLPRRLDEGANLYEEARQAFNQVISDIRQALSVSSESNLNVNALLHDADLKRIRFIDWCDRKPLDNSSGEAEATSAAPELFTDIAEVMIEFSKMEEARNQEQRRIFMEELEKCEWRSWNEIKH